MAAEILEQGGLRVEIDAGRGDFEVVELATGTRWRRDPFTGSPGALTLRERAGGRPLTLDLAHATGRHLTRLTASPTPPRSGRSGSGGGPGAAVVAC